MRRVSITIGLLALLFFAGCGASEEVEVSTQPEETLPMETIKDGYVNLAYGYGFDPAEGYDVWELTQEQTAAPAGEEATMVFVIGEEDNLFTVRGIDGARSAHEWISQEISFFYPSGNAAQRVGEIDGREAIYLRGTGGVDSPAHVVVVQNGEQLLVISYDRENREFDTMLSTFTFLET